MNMTYWLAAPLFGMVSTHTHVSLLSRPPRKPLRRSIYSHKAGPQESIRSGASGLIQAIEVTYPSLTSFEKEAGLLNQYYMATRYPDALPDNAPFEEFNEDQAEEAIDIAQRILSEVTRIVDGS